MLSKEAIEQLFIEIFTGSVNVDNLPRDLYRDTAQELFKGVEKGYKVKLAEILINNPDYAILKSYEENIYRFSAAKTFQQVYETQQKIFDEDGYKRAFNKFRDDASEIFDEFNVNWLRTEYDTSISMAQADEQWQEIQEQKETLPMLTFRTIGDDRVRPEHEALEGLTAPVDDPIWDDLTPPLDWNCRCTLEQSEDAEPTPKDEVKEMTEKVDVEDMFKFNPGKEHIAFSDVHPYFDVPEKYQEYKDRNFDLPLPKNDSNSKDFNKPILNVSNNIIKLLEFPELRQTFNYDCGVTSLQQVLCYYGIEIRESYLLDDLKAVHTDIFDNGVKLSAIKKYAEKKGLDAEIKTDLVPEDLKSYIDKKIPVIVLLQAWRDSKSPKEWSEDYVDGHYVTAIGYSKNRIIFEDPSSFNRTALGFTELAERWHDIADDNKTHLSGAAVIITGTPKFKANKITHMD